MATPSSWQKLRECAPDALPAVLAEFDSAGLFPAPGETAEQFAGRLEKLHGELSALQEGASDLQQLIAQARFPLPAAHRKAVNLTWEPFLIRNGTEYIRIDEPAKLSKVPEGVFLLVSLSMMEKLQMDL